MTEQRDARTGRIALAALVVVLLVSLVWFVHPFYEPVNDASLYILTARSILAGEGYSYQGVPFIVRPPGFSVLLAGVLGLFGTNFYALNLVVSLFGVACIAAMFVTFRRRLGTWTCLAMCLFVWTGSAWQRLCNQVLSDVPGAAMMFGCLLLERWSARERTWKRHAVLGLAITVSMYFRSINVLLVPAVLCARVAERFGGSGGDREQGGRRSWKPLLAVVLVPVLLQLPWSLRNAAADVPIPPEHVYLHSYGAAMWHTEAWDPNSPWITPADFFARIPARLEELVPALGASLGDPAPGSRDFVLGVVALVLWGVSLLRRRGAVDFLGAGVLFALSVYFAFKTRLALPAYLLILPGAVDSLRWLLGKPAGERLAGVAVLAALIVATVVEYKPFGQWPALRAQHDEYLEVARVVNRRFPGDAPLCAPHGWHYAVYLDRTVYSMRIVAARKGDPAALAWVLAKHPVGALVSDLPMEGLYLVLFRRVFAAERALSGHHVFKCP